MSVVNRRLSASGASVHQRCAKAIAEIESKEDPADIEEAVHAFLPQDEPMRSEAIETLAKVRSRAQIFSVRADALAARHADCHLLACVARRC